MRGLLRDVAYAIRLLRGTPCFSAAAVLTVALGVGANTAVFSVAKSLLLRPVPFTNPGSLVALWNEQVQTSIQTGVSWPQLAEWRAQKHLFEGLAGYNYDEDFAASSPGAESEQVNRIMVTQDFFSLAGRQPFLGRSFTGEEWQPETRGGDTLRPAVITYGMWRSRCGGRRDVLGQTLWLDGVPYAIRGVMPKDFQLLRNDGFDLFTPLRVPADHLTDRRRLYLQVIARLRPGVALETARRELETLSRRAAKEYPRTDGVLVCRVAGLHEHLYGKSRPVLLLTLAAAGMVLLIACANVAGLLLARGLRRRKEIAIRSALGAGRIEIVRLLLAESVLLALLGGGLGLILAVWGLDLFAVFAAKAALGLPPIGVDGAAIVFSVLVSLGTGLLFGLVPAVYGSRVRLNESLKEGAGTSQTGVSSHRLSNALVVSEIALSLVLLIATGLLLKSLVRLSRVELGFSSERVLTMAIGDSEWNRDFYAQEQRFWPELLERVEALPQVRAAALSHAFPLSSERAAVNLRAPITIEDRQLPPPGQVYAEYQSVTPGYFQAMGIPLKRGRHFDKRDVPKDQPDPEAPVVIINETLARMLWGSQDAVGRRMITQQRAYTVVGVVGDVRQHGPRLPAQAPQVYDPLWYPNFFKLGWHYLIVRTSTDPRSATAALKTVVGALAPERSVNLVRTMEQVAVQRTAWDRFAVLIAGLFGAIAVLLATVGTYALVSQAVSRRAPEFGVRIALGGRPTDIFRMVLGQGLLLAGAGIALGLGAAVLLTRYLAAVLFGISATDALTYASASALLCAVTLGACCFPARAATRVDPIAALKSE